MLILCEQDKNVKEKVIKLKNTTVLIFTEMKSILKYENKNALCKDYTSRGHAISGNVFCLCLEYLKW